ncbi:hypothetical protein B4U79_16540 [Dinothrombium tinctorium]|uniref:B30.2/SPRY domain-containing protein n=1 Tax=Dinothrombium tinctorium TaxID=1965070 RepID=A0A3S4QGH8_9ACAR|nr:hypothetical protein B4U79_16540 [Dinothrombium tinctorium]
MKNFSFAVATLLLVLTEATSPIPQYVCSANNVQQNGSCVRFYEIDETVISPTNCYFTFPSHGVNTGKHYYEFKFEEGSGNFVGFTTREKFGRSYSIRGLFYGGSLSDGSALLMPDFGPRISAGDKVNLLLDLSENSLKLYVFHNNVPLGLAFDLKVSNLQGLYPTVKAYGAAYVCITKLDDLPSTLERQQKVYEGIEGDFKLVQAVDNGNVVSTDVWKTFTLSIRRTIRTLYRLHFTVINTISAPLIKNEDGKYTVGTAISTMIGTYGEHAKAESFLAKVLRNFEDISIDGDILQVKAKHSTYVEFKRYQVPTPKPVTKNPLA